jgi:hypothetical protein
MFGRQPWRHQQQGTRKHIRDNGLQATLREPIDNLGAHEKQQRKYAAEAKKEKAEREKKLEEHMKEWRRLYDAEQERWLKARDKYDADMVKYKAYLEHVEQWGPQPKYKQLKEPKMPEFKEPVVRRKGGRRTRRSRKSRSTRRR